ncbi:MAG TPA: alginate lyase family protein [Anaerolineaceae bacterium]
MSLFNRMALGLQAALELGWQPVLRLACYRMGLKSGWYRLRTPPGEAYSPAGASFLPGLFTIPTQQTLRDLLSDQQAQALLAEADEIIQGKVRLFGGAPVPLSLVPAHFSTRNLPHWTAYELGKADWGAEDPKLVWEGARFGWVFALGRAYLLTGDERYPVTFWQNFEVFLEANPPNRGPNWASAQEVALRIAAFCFAGQVFTGAVSSTPQRMARLADAIAAHARRIPPTLVYARAQANNHLLSEALGLYLAGNALPAHPFASRWKRLGWRVFTQALAEQIEPEGEFTQHSLNYHRLMLHAALLFDCAARRAGAPIPATIRVLLARAVGWYAACIDIPSGQASNLGANDGACILPLFSGGFREHRPTLQAGLRAFGGASSLPAGAWDELSLWLGLETLTHSKEGNTRNGSALRIDSGDSWASLRCLGYRSRPSHSDQLHVDLWWRGENIARDAGTYRYTAPPPWDNSLSAACLHNTVTIDRRDPMWRAGKFLWLDWAQGQVLTASADQITAKHTGYRRSGLIHRRTLRRTSDGWMVEDTILPEQHNTAEGHSALLHWLLPDWDWQLEDSTLTLSHPGGGSLRINIQADIGATLQSLRLARAGSLLVGDGEISPLQGWFSPTYNLKQPALAFLAQFSGSLPLRFCTRWMLSD